MGTPKQLASLGGQALCRHAAGALAAGGYGALLAVVPPGEVGAAVRAALAGLPFAFAENPAPKRGLASSFRVAATWALAQPRPFAAVTFALADMPLVTPATHAALGQAFAESGAPAVLARYGEGEAAVHAPPHLFRADLLERVAELPDADHGPRALLREYAAGMVTVPRPVAELLDVDTPEALAQARVLFGE
ncbi:hypothetical protein ASF71_14340 [Deinococcus sp. Leaf326]|nr:hypothetical protein ASF71_14340 [Deinococcus sp. Leaf326]